MLFRKKMKDSMPLRLGEGQFCISWHGNQKDCAYDFEIETSANSYNLVYQDGKFLGIPLKNGGPLYPFSYDPAKKGSRGDKKKFKTVEVVCVSAADNLNVNWGVPDFLMFDKDGKAYDIGASGTFYVEIDPADAAKSADTFYRKLCFQKDDGGMTNEELRDKLLRAFKEVIGAKLEESIAEFDRPLSQMIGLTPKEKLEISKAVYYKVKDIFANYGITIVKVSSVNSIVDKLVVREHR